MLPNPLWGRSVLIVEDDFLIADAMIDSLQAAGASVVGPLGWIDETLAFLDDDPPAFDCAVLDVNLHGDKSYPIADRLLALDIPFVFTTGYDARAVASRYRDHPRCEKPINERGLLTLLTRCMRPAGTEAANP